MKFWVFWALYQNFREKFRFWAKLENAISNFIFSFISALPADLTPSSGLRFGTRRETYLEFNKKLRIKRRANFGVEFKTNERNGIIFYIGDDKNNDFITLFVKNGLVSTKFSVNTIMGINRIGRLFFN